MVRITALVLFIGTAVLLFAGVAVASQDEWRLLTDHRDVREVIHIDGKIWCATSGGLAEFDIASEEFTLYNTTNGLSGVSACALAKDQDNALWIGFENGTVQRFEPGHGVTHNVMGLNSADSKRKINRISANEDQLFLATRSGVSRINYSAEFDRWVWQEEFSQLGDFTIEEEVHSVTFDGQYIYAATDLGIARGDLNTPQPRVWENYTDADNLPSAITIDIINADGDIYAVTSRGMVRWETDRWDLVVPTSDIRRIYSINDTLRAVRRAKLFSYAGGLWIPISEPRNYMSSMTIDNNGNIWTGMLFDQSAVYRGGLVLATDSSFVEYIPNGPSGNAGLGFDFRENGNVIAINGYGTGHHGYSEWDGNNWKVMTRPDFTQPVFSSTNKKILADPYGGTWIGNWGAGLGYISPDDSIMMFDYSQETGSRLIGFAGNLNYVLVPDMEFDSQGNLWLTNRGADNGNVLVCIPREFVQDPVSDIEWHYFHRSHFRNYPHFDVITIDSFDRIWIGSASTTVIDGHGVYVFDPNGTLENQADDYSYGPFSGLESPIVYDLVYDDEGYIWAGTSDGAFYLNTGFYDLESQQFTSLYPLRDNLVKCIAVDVSHNKWFGTSFGVVIVANDLFTVKRRLSNERPDMLPGLNVNALGINPRTGWAYIGTEKGTAALFTPYRDYGERIKEVTIEPNPFNPNTGRMMFTGTSLGKMAEAHIFTPDGRLVRKLSHEEAALGWDGLTEEGHKVASGVYVVVTFADDGTSARGKVAVLRK